ncbi:hypothetical protein ACLBR5_10015 [Escherichia coli]
MIDSSGAIALLVYLVIAVSQLRMRNLCSRRKRNSLAHVALSLARTWLVIGFITFVLVVALFRPAQQLE